MLTSINLSNLTQFRNIDNNFIKGCHSLEKLYVLKIKKNIIN